MERLEDSSGTGLGYAASLGCRWDPDYVHAFGPESELELVELGARARGARDLLWGGQRYGAEATPRGLQPRDKLRPRGAHFGIAGVDF